MTQTPPSAALSGPQSAVQAYAGTLPHLAVPSESWGRCVIESQALCRVVPGLLMIRATGSRYPGREHWAAISFHAFYPEQSMVFDLTARQFDAAAASPWTGTLLDWYDDCCDWLADHLVIEVYLPHPEEGVGPLEEPMWTDSYDREDLDEPGEPMRAGLA